MFRINKLLMLIATIVVTAWLPVKVQAKLTEHELPTTPGSTLSNGCVYKVSKSVTITGAPGQSALIVNANSTVIIYIPKGVTLTVVGGNASGSTGAGAGISLPSSSDLVVTGDGELKATGGYIANGFSGGNGGTGEFNSNNWGKGGNGGYGGAGGGGAAAAIGGKGGNGHSQQTGPTGTWYPCNYYQKDGGDTFTHSGNDGYSTKDGDAGAAMGYLFVLGNISVTAEVAKNNSVWAASAGDIGGHGFANLFCTYTAACGNAGGGGGSGFYPAYSIGSGGYGGQCGATGGSGGTHANDHNKERKYATAGPGYGGIGFITGDKYSTYDYNDFGSFRGGKGGSQSSYNRPEPGKGYVFKAATAKVDCKVDKNRDISARSITENFTYKSLPGLMKVTLTCIAGNNTINKDCYYGEPMTKVDVPTNNGLKFEGYYTADGTQYFDAKGNPVASTCFYLEDVKLFARWGEGTMVIRNNSDLKSFFDAIYAGAQNLNAELACNINANYSRWDLEYVSMDVPYMGTFNGNNYTIYNMSIKFGNNAYLGIFPYLGAKGVVKNVMFENIKLYTTYSYYSVGAIVGRNDGTVERCGTVGTYYVDGSWGSYGIVAYHRGGKIVDCFTRAKQVKGSGSGTVTNSYANDSNSDWKDMTSGKVCYLLNHEGHLPFRQTLGEDLTPVFHTDHEKVGYDKDTKQYHNLNYLLLPDRVSVCTDFYPTENTSVLAHYGFDPMDNDKTYSPTLFGAEDTDKSSFQYKLIRSGGTFSANAVFGKDENNEVKTLAIDHQFDSYDYYDHYFGMSRQELFVDASAVAPEHEYYNSLAKKLSCETSKAPLYIGTTDSTNVTAPLYVHEFNVMDGGVLMHRFLPSKFNGGKGLYDVVKNTFCPVSELNGVEVHIPYCDHRYSVVEYRDNVAYHHCVICDELDCESNYRLVHYNANAPEGAKIDGMMGDELFVAPANNHDYRDAKLRKNCYRTPMYKFDHWKDDNGNMYNDECTLQITDNDRGSLMLYAQWIPCYTVNGDTLSIPSVLPEGAGEDASKAENIADAIEIKDSPDNHYGFATAVPFKIKNLTYTRTLSKGSNWGSLCLPFELTSNADVQYYLTADVDGDQITLHPTDKVSAGVPCVFLLLKETEELKLTAPGEVVFDGKVQDGSKGGNVTLYGTYVYQDFKCEEQGLPYYAIQDGTFYNVKSAMVVRPYRAYMRMQNIEPKVRERLYITNEEGTEVTAVEAFDPEEVKVIGMFDIGGSPQNRLGKGLNIIRFSDGTTKKIYLK